MSETLRAELSRVAARLGADGLDFVLERPRDAGHGDLATNLAMVLARRDRANPRKTAERVLQELKLPPDLIARTEIAGPVPGRETSLDDIGERVLRAHEPPQPRPGHEEGRRQSEARNPDHHPETS